MPWEKVRVKYRPKEGRRREKMTEISIGLNHVKWVKTGDISIPITDNTKKEGLACRIWKFCGFWDDGVYCQSIRFGDQGSII